MVRKKYGVVNLPRDLVDELKVWRAAFIAAYRREMTYADMIRGMLDSLETSDPAVWEEYEKIQQRKDQQK